MGSGRKGLSQNDQIALWQGYLQKNFTLTKKRVTFNGKVRKVYQAEAADQAVGRAGVFVVLDEWHGALEVLDEKANHLGSLQLNIGEDGAVGLGTFKSGRTHSFAWTSG